MESHEFKFSRKVIHSLVKKIFRFILNKLLSDEQSSDSDGDIITVSENIIEASSSHQIVTWKLKNQVMILMRFHHQPNLNDIKCYLVYFDCIHNSI